MAIKLGKMGIVMPQVIFIGDNLGMGNKSSNASLTPNVHVLFPHICNIPRYLTTLFVAYLGQ